MRQQVPYHFVGGALWPVHRRNGVPGALWQVGVEALRKVRRGSANATGIGLTAK